MILTILMDTKFSYHSQIKKGIVALVNSSLFRSTGFLIGRTGLCLTAWHNVKDTLMTTQDGAFVDILAHNENLDIALVQLPSNRYHYLDIGNSDNLQLGDRIFHYGFGMNELMGFHGYFQTNVEDKLYTSAHMMHGQSGGPLLNGEGKVVGINKGHFYCTQEKLENAPCHTGPSLYIPVNNIKNFLAEHAKYTSQGWVSN